MLEFDDGVPQALVDRNEYLLRFVSLLVLVRRQLLEARDACLAFRLSRPGVGAYPLKLLVHRLDACNLLLLLDRQPLFLLFQPGAVVALPRNAIAAVEFEDP